MCDDSHLTPCSVGRLLAVLDRCVCELVRHPIDCVTPPRELAALAATLTLANAALAPTVTTVYMHDTLNSNVSSRTNGANNCVFTNHNGRLSNQSHGYMNAAATHDNASSSEYRVNHRDLAAELFTHLLTTDRIEHE